MFTVEHIIRHEAGHAVVAHKLGRSVKVMVWRTNKKGDVQGDVDCGPRVDDAQYLTILAAGLTADYVNSRMPRINDEDDPFTPNVDDMVDWEREYLSSMVARMIADSDMKAMRFIQTGETIDLTQDASIADAPPQVVQRAIEILVNEWDLVCDLIEYAIPRRPGLGPRELQRFFSGKRPNWWLRLMDKPWVTLARLEQWKSAGRII